MAVSTFIVTCVPSCCSLRELLLARVAVRGPGARLALAGRLEIPGRGGAREGDGDTLALLAQLVGIVQRSARRHLHSDLLQA